MSVCLERVYGKKAVILIDEYDVPLESAYFQGFYDKMIGLLRAMFESALKTNGALEFAVMTGCLRISRESIFTGLNSLNIVSVRSSMYAEYFGFLQKEVDKTLAFYGLEDCGEEVKRWYDGYCFGESEVYNPWSLINYVKQRYDSQAYLPEPYWSNTGGNSIVRVLIDRADAEARGELEGLIVGGTIEKPIHEDITYDEMDSTMDHLWNFLFFTGYLTKLSERQEGRRAEVPPILNASNLSASATDVDKIRVGPGFSSLRAGLLKLLSRFCGCSQFLSFGNIMIVFQEQK